MDQGILILLFVVAAIAIALIALASVRKTRPRPTTIRHHMPPATRKLDTVPPGSGIEALFALLLIGMAGVALYKFIELGSLTRLLRRIGDLPLQVDGRTTTIAAAVKDDAYIRRLLLEAIQAKLNSVDGNEPTTIDLDNEPGASDVAALLRDALQRRFRGRGI